MVNWPTRAGVVISAAPPSRTWESVATSLSVTAEDVCAGGGAVPVRDINQEHSGFCDGGFWSIICTIYSPAPRVLARLTAHQVRRRTGFGAGTREPPAGQWHGGQCGTSPGSALWWWAALERGVSLIHRGVIRGAHKHPGVRRVKKKKKKVINNKYSLITSTFVFV